MAGTVIVPALLMNKLPYLARPAGSKPDKIVEGEFNDFALRGRWWIATMTKRRRPEQKTLKQTKMRMVLLLLQSKDACFNKDPLRRYVQQGILRESNALTRWANLRFAVCYLGESICCGGLAATAFRSRLRQRFPPGGCRPLFPNLHLSLSVPCGSLIGDGLCSRGSRLSTLLLHLQRMHAAFLLVLHAGKCDLMLLLQSPRGLASEPGKEASAAEPQGDDSGGRLFSLGSKFGLPFSLGDALAEEAKASAKGSSTVGGAWRRLQPLDLRPPGRIGEG